jgi:hypothetical protein
MKRFEPLGATETVKNMLHVDLSKRFDVSDAAEDIVKYVGIICPTLQLYCTLKSNSLENDMEEETELE